MLACLQTLWFKDTVLYLPEIEVLGVLFIMGIKRTTWPRGALSALGVVWGAVAQSPTPERSACTSLTT